LDEVKKPILDKYALIEKSMRTLQIDNLTALSRNEYLKEHSIVLFTEQNFSSSLLRGRDTLPRVPMAWPVEKD
jgi:hypothetical protein